MVQLTEFVCREDDYDKTAFGIEVVKVIQILDLIGLLSMNRHIRDKHHLFRKLFEIDPASVNGLLWREVVKRLVLLRVKITTLERMDLFLLVKARRATTSWDRFIIIF